MKSFEHHLKTQIITFKNETSYFYYPFSEFIKDESLYHIPSISPIHNAQLIRRYWIDGNGSFEDEHGIIYTDPVSCEAYADNMETYKERYLGEGGLDWYKRRKWMAMNDELRTFIYNRYDEGTQNSFNSEFAVVVDTQHTRTLTQQEELIKTYCKTVRNWIAQVMLHYYQKREDIFNATTIEAIDTVTPHFQEYYGDNGTVYKDHKIKLSQFFGFSPKD